MRRKRKNLKKSHRRNRQMIKRDKLDWIFNIKNIFVKNDFFKKEKWCQNLIKLPPDKFPWSNFACVTIRHINNIFFTNIINFRKNSPTFFSLSPFLPCFLAIVPVLPTILVFPEISPLAIQRMTPILPWTLTNPMRP